MFSFLASGDISETDLVGEVSLDDSCRFEPRGYRRLALAILVTVRKLLAATPECYTSPFKPAYSRRFLGMEAEDIARAVMFIRCSTRKAQTVGEGCYHGAIKPDVIKDVGESSSKIENEDIDYRSLGAHHDAGGEWSFADLHMLCLGTSPSQYSRQS